MHSHAYFLAVRSTLSALVCSLFRCSGRKEIRSPTICCFWMLSERPGDMQMILFCGVSNRPGGQASAGPIGPAHFASAAHMCTPVPTPCVCGGWQAESGGALDGLKSREMAVAPGGPSSSSWTAIRVCPGAGIPQPGDPGRRRPGLGRPRTSTRCPAPPDRLLRRAGFRDPQDNDRSVRRTRPANR